MANIYITGGTGFIGRNLISLLNSRGHKCFVITRKPSSYNNSSIHFLKCDLLNCENFDSLFKIAKPDLLIHLAWDIKTKDYSSSKVNLLWLEKSIQLCKSFIRSGGKKVIVAGTCFEYDLSRKVILKENSPCVPTTLYGQSKQKLHKSLYKLCKQYSTNLVWTRIFYAYGPNEEKRKIISYVVNNLTNKENVKIKTPYDVIDYIHVTDISRALSLLAELNTKGIFNICSGKGTPIIEIVRHIAKRYGREDCLSFDSSESPKYIVGDNSKLLKLGFNCRYDIYQVISTYF